jgi:hypothetical protein
MNRDPDNPKSSPEAKKQDETTADARTKRETPQRDTELKCDDSLFNALIGGNVRRPPPPP